MRAWIAVAAAVALVGCVDHKDQFGYDGYPMDDFFPFDGQRSWTFTSTDDTIPYTVVGVLNTTPETAADGASVFTIDYTTHCLGEDTGCVDGDYRLRSLSMSSDQIRGTEFHGFDAESTGPVVLDPPVQITEDRGVPDDVITSDSGGETWMTTFDQIGECPVLMSVDWDQCIKLQIRDADGNETSPLHGDWYAVTGYNVIAMQLMDDTGQWQLSDTTFEAL
jgi:hypothetical protein